MKKYGALLAVLVLMIAVTPQTYAVAEASGPGARREALKDIKNAVKENREDLKEELKGMKGTPRPTLAAMRKNLNLMARLSDVTLVTKTGTMTAGTLTVKTKEGTVLTINLTGDSHMMRRFWGKVGSLDEMQVGDMLNIVGKYTDETKTAVNAILVRDRSIQKRFGAFIGTVSNVSATGFTLSTPNRGSQSVTLVSSTKLTDRTGKTTGASDVQNGHRVRVQGLWDSAAKTVTGVTHVKDFTLPIKPTAVPTK